MLVDWLILADSVAFCYDMTIHVIFVRPDLTAHIILYAGGLVNSS